MKALPICILTSIGFGLFFYFVSYRNIKIVLEKQVTIIELLNKKDNN